MTFQQKYKDSRNPKSVQDGLEFQDFVIDKCKEHFGLVIQCYSSQKYQSAKGESVDGTEIKFDRHCTNTGRLSIEVEERSSEDKLFWWPSGIDSKDRSRTYVQGNLVRFWVFDTDDLRKYWVTEAPEIHENTPTVRSFYVSLFWANRAARHVWCKTMEHKNKERA
jgi:hypothetical protein